ncbi:MAG: DNA-directed RNA polymerase subunit beta, partial [Rhodobacteraceae bacterium]|nr:DNA-directed RNA polymerase subunit beta [Paracoccaceae bacterium]
MSAATVHRNRYRRSYQRIREVVDMPNLIEIQLDSYAKFIHSGDVVGSGRHEDGVGLHGVFQSVFPIKDFNGAAELEYVRYEIDEPGFDVNECLQRDMTYAAPLRVHLRLIVFDVKDDSNREVKNIKESSVYIGEIPLMTEKGTFIVNGAERVVVSQMHRSPGVYFSEETHSSGRNLFNCRILPSRGAWIDFEFDIRKYKSIGEVETVNIQIDRKRKVPVTSMLFAMGMDQGA